MSSCLYMLLAFQINMKDYALTYESERYVSVRRMKSAA